MCPHPEPEFMSDADGPIGVLVDVVAIAHGERIMYRAASVAYFMFISLVPLLLLLVVVVSVLGDEALAARTVSRAARTLTAENAVIVTEIVFTAANRQQATIIGAAVLLWGALLTFHALATAFAGIYDTRGDPSLLRAGTDVVVVFIVIVLAVVAMVAGGVILSVFVRTRLWNTLGPLVLFVVLAVVFLPLYYILPDVDVRFVEVVPGTVFAAAGWTILQALFGYYTAVSGITRIYGAASAFLLILVWLYAGGFVLLLGAALNAVLAGHADPDPKWTPIEHYR